MSWSVSAMGKAEAVGRSLELQFSNLSPMAEPEESAKNSIRAIAQSVCTTVPELGIIFKASGSQWGDGTKVHHINVQLSLETVHVAE